MELKELLVVKIAVVYLCSFLLVIAKLADASSEEPLFAIEGKVALPHQADQAWHSNTRVLVDGGRFLGFLRNDGSFAIQNVPSGSYVVEVANPTHIYDPVRVDITSKGKTRARKVNNLVGSGSKPEILPYPLKLKSRGAAAYFQIREEWRITDLLKNPMVLMMVLPLVVIVILPKMMNMQDPDTQKDMQQQMNLFNTANKPNFDLSEMFTNVFGGGSSQKSKPSKSSGKIRKRTS